MRAYDPKFQDVCDYAAGCVKRRELARFFESALREVRRYVVYINDKHEGFEKHDLQKIYEQSRKGYGEQKTSILARLRALNKSNPDPRYKQIIQVLQGLKISKTTSAKGAIMAKRAKKAKTKVRKSGRVSVKAHTRRYPR